MEQKRPEFAQIYHQSSKNPFTGHELVPPNYDNWPEEWKTTYYKTYPRLPKIQLPQTTYSADLFKTIAARKTRRSFRGEPLTIDQYSALFQYGTGIVRPEDKTEDGRSFRAIPSAGTRFPIETYAAIFHGNEDIRPGLYHYNIKNHQLVRLWDRVFTAEDARKLVRAPWIGNAAVLVLHTAVFWRTQVKYGERGYRYVLIEAGHIAQNMHLVAEALHIKCCALGGTNDPEIEKLLDIDGNTESLVYAAAYGR